MSFGRPPREQSSHRGDLNERTSHGALAASIMPHAADAIVIPPHETGPLEYASGIPSEGTIILQPVGGRIPIYPVDSSDAPLSRLRLEG